MACEICNHYAFTVIGEKDGRDKISCNNCGNIQLDRDWEKCSICGNKIEKDNTKNHYESNHQDWLKQNVDSFGETSDSV